MVAVSSDGNTSAIIAIVEPSSETAGMTAESFLKAQTERMQSSLSGSNYSYTTVDGDIVFDGSSTKLPANTTTITVDGKTLVVGQAVAEKNGYFLDALVTSTSEDAVLNTFQTFKAKTE